MEMDESDRHTGRAAWGHAATRRRVVQGTGVTAVSGVLAACGLAGTQGEPAAPAAVSGKIKMAYRLRSPHTDVYGAIGDEFRQKNPSIQLENEPVPGDFGLKVL